MTEFKNESRVEGILENMLGASNTLKPSQSRVEALLLALMEKIEEMSKASGKAFRLLGEKDAIDDLPASGNTVGDVWFVKEKMAGFIWLVREDYPDGYWEELGEVIDTASLDTIELFISDSPITPSPVDIRAAVAADKIPVITEGLHYYFPTTIDAHECVFFTVVDGKIHELYWDATSSTWMVTIHDYVRNSQSTTNAVLVTDNNGLVGTKAISEFAQPIVFHAEPANQLDPFGGGFITESREEFEAAYGKPAVVTITFPDGTNVVLPITWHRLNGQDHVNPVAAIPFVYFYYDTWVYLVVDYSLDTATFTRYKWEAHMFALTPLNPTSDGE